MALPQTFITANAFTQKWEKGFVNHPKDPGGITYNGLSLRFLQDRKLDFDGDGKVNANDILWLYANQRQDKVDETFYQAFWKEFGLDKFGSCRHVQVALYDTAVNCGIGRAVKCLQQACNVFNLFGFARLAVDGALGPKTREYALAVIGENSGPWLGQAIVKARRDFHQSLADKSPYPDGRDYRPFIKGWLNRCTALATYLEQL